MNATWVRQTLKANRIIFREELGHSGFNYTRFVFKDRDTARRAEKLLGARITNYSYNFSLIIY